jgi:hypothetical protein
LWINFLAKQNNHCYISELILVGVAQLVEHWVVASVVVGSSPIIHPKKDKRNRAVNSFPVFLFWETFGFINVLGNISEKHL